MALGLTDDQHALADSLRAVALGGRAEVLVGERVHTAQGGAPVVFGSAIDDDCPGVPWLAGTP